MTEESSEESVNETSDAVEPAKKEDSKDGVSLQTKLLALPLFVKFCIVIVLKIVTDCILIPVLILFRSARSVKRWFLKLIGKDASSVSPNGAAPKP